MNSVKNKKISVTMLGLRGFPNVQGGVETHCEQLCPLLVELGCNVTVLTRSPYQPTKFDSEWKGVKLVSLFSPSSRGLEAIVHTFLGVFYAGITRPDILHIQAIGPAIMTPLARLLGLNVVVTNHGPDYDRQKWGGFAKWILKTGERLGVTFSSERIVISQVINQLVSRKYKKNSVIIPNGVNLPVILETVETLENFGLTAGHYVLLVSRIVPEKRHIDLIKAFELANLPDLKLVLVGASDHPDDYTKSVLEEAGNTANVVCTGFQTGTALQELYSHASIFVLPSSHEGLPIALLEALSYGLPVIASDIPANLEIGLSENNYFNLGDQPQLAERLVEFANQLHNSNDREKIRSWVIERYNWKKVATQTLNVYQKVLNYQK